MQVNPNTYLDMAGLQQLHAEAQHNSPKALKAAAQQFEALFVNMMLKSMRNATLTDGKGIMDSSQTRFYQGMFDQQIALEVSKGDGIGLAKMLEQQLSKTLPDNSTAGTATGKPGPAGGVRPATQAASTVAATATAASGQTASQDSSSAPTPEQFVAGLWSHAKAIGQALGVSPKVLVAQAALETGWGKGTVRTADGTSSHNLFGIKADAQWQGPSATATTLEFRHGIPTPERAAFRAYPSQAASFADYAKFLQSNPRYREALNAAHDPKAFVQALQRAGYATDPQYARKLLGVLHSPALQGAVAALKDSSGRSLT